MRHKTIGNFFIWATVEIDGDYTYLQEAIRVGNEKIDFILCQIQKVRELEQEEVDTIYKENECKISGFISYKRNLCYEFKNITPLEYLETENRIEKINEEEFIDETMFYQAILNIRKKCTHTQQQLQTQKY